MGEWPGWPMQCLSTHERSDCAIASPLPHQWPQWSKSLILEQEYPEDPISRLLHRYKTPKATEVPAGPWIYSNPAPKAMVYQHSLPSPKQWLPVDGSIMALILHGLLLGSPAFLFGSTPAGEGSRPRETQVLHTRSKRTATQNFGFVKHAAELSNAEGWQLHWAWSMWIKQFPFSDRNFHCLRQQNRKSSSP